MSAEHMGQHCKDHIFARHNVGHSLCLEPKHQGWESYLNINSYLFTVKKCSQQRDYIILHLKVVILLVIPFCTE